jgi:hypothetical protein
MELEIAIELGLHVNGTQRELVDGSSTAKRGRLLLVGRAGATDDLLARAGSKPASVATLILALPPVEVEVPVVEEVTEVEVVPAETRLLLVGTLVVGVSRAGERGSPVELRDVVSAISRGPLE